MNTRDFTRTFGDFLLGHVYERAGGDGRSVVRIEPYRAAVLVTGEARPTNGDVRQCYEVLRALALEPERTGEFRVEKCPEVESTFIIRPRSIAQPRRGGSTA